MVKNCHESVLLGLSAEDVDGVPAYGLGFVLHSCAIRRLRNWELPLASSSTGRNRVLSMQPCANSACIHVKLSNTAVSVAEQQHP